MRDLDASPPLAGEDEPDLDVVVDLATGTVEPIGSKRYSPLPSADVQIVRRMRYDRPPQQHVSTRFRMVDAQLPHRTAPTTRRGSARKRPRAWVIGAVLVVALATSAVWAGIAGLGAQHENGDVSGTKASDSRPIAPGSSKPSTSRTGLVAASPSTGRGRATRVDVTAPTDGATLDRCLLVTGTSRALPVQHTLVLATTPIGGKAVIRLTPVEGRARPGTLTSWTARTIVEPSSVGRRFSVRVVEMPVSTVRHAMHLSADSSSWSVTVLPAGTSVRDSVTVAVRSSSIRCEG